MEPQFEKNLVINNRELKYQGIFHVDELVAAINRALEERGYEKQEKKTEELVTESGRRIYLELRPIKIKSNYARLMIKIKCTADNVREQTEVIAGQKRKFQQGQLLFVFDAWSLTDYEARWGMKPWVYFLKGVINKYLYTFPLEAGYIGELKQDTAHVYGQIKKLLNSYRVAEGKIGKEEDIIKEMEEEIAKAEKEET